MSKYAITDTTLTNIADAIRAKTGGSAQLTPTEMATEIAGISGGIPVEQIANKADMTGAINTGAAQYFSGYAFCNSAITAADCPNILQISNEAFNGCAQLARVSFPAATTWGGRAFTSCDLLTEIWLPVCSTYGSMVAYYSHLATIKIGHASPRMESNTFYGASYLRHIYVPWSEGAVSGAPWGATNATIHYNTQFDSDGNIVS